MAKKSRKKKKQYVARHNTGAFSRTVDQPAMVQAPQKASQTLPGYEYVRKDLRRAGLLTAGIIVLLVILALVVG